MSEEKEMQEAQALSRRLPSTYSRLTNSSLFRLFRIIGAEFAQVREALTSTERYRDVDQATGKTLDLLGANVAQSRGQVSDNTYRGLIKAKIARNLSPGDIDSIKRIVSVMLSVPVSEVSVTPFWRRVEQEPAAVEIAAPLYALAQYQLTPDKWVEIMRLIVAAGVRVSALLSGTFQFSSLSDQSQYDPEKGFANPEQTTGGRLGAYYDAPSPDLPIER